LLDLRVGHKFNVSTRELKDEGWKVWRFKPNLGCNVEDNMLEAKWKFGMNEWTKNHAPTLGHA
jgi:hypothetical protein